MAHAIANSGIGIPQLNQRTDSDVRWFDRIELVNGESRNLSRHDIGIGFRLSILDAQFRHRIVAITSTTTGG
ncbi:MAG: hypothetical protein ABJB66_04625 [Gemmatimonadaceae bacterium]